MINVQKLIEKAKTSYSEFYYEALEEIEKTGKVLKLIEMLINKYNLKISEGDYSLRGSIHIYPPYEDEPVPKEFIHEISQVLEIPFKRNEQIKGGRADIFFNGNCNGVMIFINKILIPCKVVQVGEETKPILKVVCEEEI